MIFGVMSTVTLATFSLQNKVDRVEELISILDYVKRLFESVGS